MAWTEALRDKKTKGYVLRPFKERTIKQHIGRFVEIVGTTLFFLDIGLWILYCFISLVRFLFFGVEFTDLGIVWFFSFILMLLIIGGSTQYLMKWLYS